MYKVIKFFIGFILLVFSNHLRSQSLPSGNYTFSFKQIKLVEALEQIQQKTQLNFTYSTDNLKMDEIISLEVKNEKLQILFDKLFSKHQIKWTLVGNQVALKQQKKK